MEEAVSLRWFNLDFNPGDTISVVTEKLHEKRSLDFASLPQSVYVIRLAGNFAIEYPGGLSPVVYIGQGKFRGRLNAHRKWLAKLHNLIAQSPLQVRFCMPRSNDGLPLHKELEAHLLRSFEEKYQQRPIQNKQGGKLKTEHVFPKGKVGHTLGPGAGKKYAWALRPLKENPYFKPPKDA